MKSWKTTLALLAGFSASFGCGELPNVTPSPYPLEDPALLRSQSAQGSAALEAYILDWLDGNAPAQIPENLLPQGRNMEIFPAATLVDPTTMTAEEQWAIAPGLTHPVGPGESGNLFRVHNTTYGWMTFPLAPFGTTIKMEGRFPRARYFSLCMPAPFSGLEYNNGGDGHEDLCIMDADINPDPGNVNPYRVGANRLAPNRDYTVYFHTTQATSDADRIAKNPDQRPETYYRDHGQGPNANHRWVSLITFNGPPVAGDYLGTTGGWNLGEQVWLRYYYPEDAFLDGGDPSAGAGYPKITMTLDSDPLQRPFYIHGDKALIEEFGNKRFTVDAALNTSNETSTYDGKNTGWWKHFGIITYLSAAYWHDATSIAGFKDATKLLTGAWTQAQGKQWVYDYVKGLNGRSYDAPPPRNWEEGQSMLPHYTILHKDGVSRDGMVTVLMGKLPTFPPTNDGYPVMEGNKQVRYYNISGYSSGHLNGDPNTTDFSLAAWSIMDEEILIDANRQFYLVVSTAADRPANATAANGVTWVNSNNAGGFGAVIRWLSAYPEHWTPQNPHEINIPWAVGSWESPFYDANYIGQNDQNGTMGNLQPIGWVFHKTCFEQLGNNITQSRVLSKPWWGCRPSSCGAAPVAAEGSHRGLIAMAPLALALLALLGHGIVRTRRRGAAS